MPEPLCIASHIRPYSCTSFPAAKMGRRTTGSQTTKYGYMLGIRLLRHRGLCWFTVNWNSGRSALASWGRRPAKGVAAFVP